MNKVKLYGIVIIGLLISNILLISYIQFRKPPHPAHQKPREIIIERLHFDKEQTEAYDKIIKQHQQAIRSKEQQIMDTKKELYLLVGKDQGSTQKDSLITLLGNLQTDIEKIHYNHFGEILHLCRSEQLNDFNELLNEIATLFSRPMMEKPKE